ncbi:MULTISPECIES: hypothetical protein [unclassified Variovorax]|uniref:hypothetical protein n=1 Tax=unclassified Variovorax TaxID=663243 RepID=UPI0034E9373A
MTHAKPAKSFQQIKAQFGRTFHRGDRVTCGGRPGTIVGVRYPHIRVRFDGQRISVPCDPLELEVAKPNPSTLPAHQLFPSQGTIEERAKDSKV